MKKFFAANFWKAWHWASGMFAGVGVAELPPTVPGLEFTVDRGRTHFALPENLVQFTLLRNRAHLDVPEDD